MEEKEKEDGISIGEILHVIFIKKWLLLAVTIVIALIGVIFVQAFYNPSKEEYQATFQIRYPHSDTGKYPDGNEFIFQEFITLENLQRAKDSNEEFKSINIEKMKKTNQITISELELEINEVPTKTGIFTIYIYKDYFKSTAQAVEFFRTLINQPAGDVIEKSKLIDYDRYLKQYNLVDDYVSKLDVLIKQKDMIIEGYQTYIEEYSNAHTITIKNPDGTSTVKTISAAQSDIESYFAKYNLDAMKAEVEKNGYADPNSEFLLNIRSEIHRLELEKEENVLKITALKSQLEELRKILAGTTTETAYQDIIKSISELTERNASIDFEIKQYEVYDSASKDPNMAENLKGFKERIDVHYKKLLEFTDEYQAFNQELYESNTKVIISAGSVITERGGMNVFVALAIFLVAGFIVGCCINLAFDLPKFLKETKADTVKPENKEEDKPAEE